MGQLFELPCPVCGEGKVRLRERPSRAEIDTSLPPSMRPLPAGTEDRRRFDGETGCEACGLDGNVAAEAVEADGLPGTAREVGADEA